jgi:predicted aminopeptidase
LKLKTVGKVKKALLVCAVLLVVCVVTGCRTLSFYGQAVKGQFKLLAARESIDRLMQSTNTPPELKQRFEVLEDIRKFAAQELALNVDGHYRTYADLKRPYVLWNVEAAPEFSMTPKKWWYPLVGRQKYRGYFAHPGATNYAAALGEKGYDTYVGGVQAYSTLGWFKDTTLNTFIFDPDPYLAELVFHELAHQEVFARGDTDFNEAFATTVGQEGARRWLKLRRSPEMFADYERDLARNEQFVALVARARQQLEELYGDTRNEDGELQPNRNAHRDTHALRARKNEIFRELLANYEGLKEQWNGDATYDRWFSRQLNNAKLNSVANYYDLVPGFKALLELEKGNLTNFYAAAKRLANMSKQDRREWLQVLVQSSNQPEETKSATLEKPSG